LWVAAAPDVDGPAALAPHGAFLARLQGAQQLALEPERELADGFEEDRAVALFDEEARAARLPFRQSCRNGTRFWQSWPSYAGGWACLLPACFLLAWAGMTTTARPTSASLSGSDDNATDLGLLLELAEVFGKLRRHQIDSVLASKDLRQCRLRVVHLEALLRADSTRLATLRESGTGDQVTMALLDKAVAGARRELSSANDSAAASSDALGPELERLSSAMRDLEGRVGELRAKLSPATVRTLDTLARRNISPPIAALEDQVCGACHLRLPTALANPEVIGSAVRRCPHCKRILLPAGRRQVGSAS
jgi:predicted  nucleic acid-binding Zn-ribbon protein